MLHKVTYNAHDVDRKGHVSKIPSNESLVAFTDAEVDEIPEKIAQFHLEQKGEIVKIKVLKQEIEQATVILVANLTNTGLTKFSEIRTRMQEFNRDGSDLLLDPNNYSNYKK